MNIYDLHTELVKLNLEHSGLELKLIDCINNATMPSGNHDSYDEFLAWRWETNQLCKDVLRVMK